MFLSLLKPQFFPFLLLIRFLLFFSSCPIQFLFISYSSLIDFLFNSYSFPTHFFFHFLFIFIYVLFMSFSFSFISFHFVWPEKFTKIPKSKDMVLYQSLIKKLFISSPKSIGKGATPRAEKKWSIKGVVSKVLGLDGSSSPIQFLVIVYWFPIHSFLISSSILIYFLFNSYSFWFLSFPNLFKKSNWEMKGNEMKWTERKRKQKQPKIQSRIPNTLANTKCSPYIVPNTFSNKESIAREDSLHNQLKKIIYLPSTVEEGGVINHFPKLSFIATSEIHSFSDDSKGGWSHWFLSALFEAPFAFQGRGKFFETFVPLRRVFDHWSQGA